MNTQGTPKTLLEAIQNGMRESTDAATIEAHVRDFLANYFAPAILQSADQSEDVSIALRAVYNRLIQKAQEKGEYHL